LNTSTAQNVSEMSAPSAATTAKDPRYTKGTLYYTKQGLQLVFAYLLLGDFCLQMMEMVIPALMPLQLKAIGASNTVMSVLLITTTYLFNLTMNPLISFKSDNLRTRWGRRIPILIVTAPLCTLFLILLAFAPDFGRALHATALVSWLKLSPLTVMIGTIAVLLVMFQCFHFCLTPVYYYLFVDVVPDAFMGRFMALFRVVATLCSYLFNTFIYGHALSHTRSIYIGCAIVYFTGFMLMCLLVKESDYPPPVHGKRLGFVNSCKVYAKECFSHRHYLLFNARNAFWYLSSLCTIYYVFFFRDALGISLDFIGKVNAWSSLISAALLIPMGMLSDRFKPVRVVLLAMGLVLPVSLLNFFFIHDKISYVIMTLIGIPITTLIAASELPFWASIPPQERYGQFGSANQIACSLAVIIGGVPAGWYMDWLTNNGTIVANYRYGYLWTFTFQFISFLFMYKLYRSWKHYGGPDHYTPPAV